MWNIECHVRRLPDALGSFGLGTCRVMHYAAKQGAQRIYEISDHQAGGMGMAPRRGRDHALLVVADL